MFGQPQELSRYKTNSERAIAKRKIHIQNQSWLTGKIKNEEHMLHLAEWEIKGKQLSKKKFIKNRMTQMRQQARDNLNVRKSKLAMMLKQEEDKYRNELQFIELTEEQVRENMRTKVNKLKKDKEDQRQAYVAKQLKRQFRERADELRKIESNLNEIKTMQEREIQMLERQKHLEDKYQEEMIYAMLYKKQIQAKGLIEQQKKAAQMSRVQQRNQILAVQCEQRKQTRFQNEIAKQQERNMLNDQWKLDDQRHHQRQVEEHHRKMELNRTLQISNAEQKMYKTKQQKMIQAEDRRMIKEIVEREKMQDQLDKEKIERQKEETRQFLLNFKDRRSETHALDALETKLIEEENQKQWKQRQKIWKAEEEARIKLMYDVYNNRDQKLTNNEKLKQAEQEEVVRDRQYEDNLQQQFFKEKEEKRLRRAQQNKVHQQALLGQIDVKVNNRAQEEAEIKRKHMQNVQKEQAYSAQIQFELEEGKRKLAAQRKQRLY